MMHTDGAGVLGSVMTVDSFDEAFTEIGRCQVLQVVLKNHHAIIGAKRKSMLLKKTAEQGEIIRVMVGAERYFQRLLQ